MATETLTIERFRCDRCDASEDIPSGTLERRSLWGHASAQRYQGAQIYTVDYKIDLCPKCCDALRAWALTA